MKIISTYDLHFGIGKDEEVIERGDEFEPRGTGLQNAREHAESLIRAGVAMTPEQWAKRSPLRDANAAAVAAMVDAARAASPAGK